MVDWHAKVYGASGGTSGQRPPRSSRIPAAKRRELIAIQGDCCFYCDRKIGTRYRHRGVEGELRRAWDHFKPYAYVEGSGGDANWILSCNVCNAVKSDRHFASPADARQVLRREVAARTGYNGWEFLGEGEEDRACAHCGKSLTGTRRFKFCSPAHQRAHFRLLNRSERELSIDSDEQAPRPAWHSWVYGGQRNPNLGPK